MEELKEISAGKATQDERILAALAHASIIIPFWGLIGAIVIWVTQREKSRFVGFQALQGAVYQLSLILLAILGGVCYMCSFFGMFLAVPASFAGIESTGGPNGPGPGELLAMLITFLTSFFPFCVMGIFILLWLALVLYAMYGALRVLQGHDFRYTIIGNRLEEYLSQ